MRLLLAGTLLIWAMPLVAGEDPRIAEGIALHNAGRYDEAIAKYKEALADVPGDPLATYEMGFAFQAKGDYAGCRATLEPLANTRDRLQPMILAILGTCLDLAGESKRAIGVFRKGLKIAPEDPLLLFNLAVTLSRQNKNDEARELLKKELALRPDHASGHYLLGQIFQEQGFRAPAVLTYLRMLAVESGTPRAADAAQRVVGLLNLGVERVDEKNVNVTIDPRSRTEEGDFKGWEMMMAIAAAAKFTRENASESEFEQTRSQLASSLRMLIEAPPRGKSYSVRQNVPYFARMEQAKVLDAFAGVAIMPLGLEGAEAWASSNEEAVRAFAAFARGPAQ